MICPAGVDNTPELLTKLYKSIQYCSSPVRRDARRHPMGSSTDQTTDAETDPTEVRDFGTLDEWRITRGQDAFYIHCGQPILHSATAQALADRIRKIPGVAKAGC